MDYNLHHRILVWLEVAATKLRQSLDQPVRIEQKTSASDLVTEMDRKIEQFLVGKIREYYPEHRVIGEEGMGDKIDDTQGIIWVIDPIDGTLNYVKQKDNFAIMVGIYLNGQPLAGYIYDVMQSDLYYGIVGDGVYLNNYPLESNKEMMLTETLMIASHQFMQENKYNALELKRKTLGIRYSGSAALELISVIRGMAGIYVSRKLELWDFAAGYAILTAMSYKGSRLNGQPLDITQASSAVLAHPTVYQEAIEIMNQRD